MRKYTIRRTRASCSLNSFWSVVRGAAVGFLLACCFNVFQHNYGDRDAHEEPEIPEKYMKNLSAPHPPVSGEYRFLLSPTKIEKYLKKNRQNRCYITIMVQGAESAKERFLIRFSWATIQEIDGKRICVFFVMAKSINTATDYLIKEENQMYGDILQSNLPNTVNFSSMLVLSAFQWVIEKIGHRSNYYVTILSDIMPDLPNLYEYCLKMDYSEQKESFHCGFHLNPAHPKPSDPSSKNYVSIQEYPTLMYPTYCAPEIVIQSDKLASNLYETSRFTYAGKISVGGVFVWGILREKMRKKAESNIISAEDFLRSKELLPLGRKIDLKAVKELKDMMVLFDEMRQSLIFNPSEKNSSGYKRRTAVLDKFPTSNTQMTPERDMQIFILKWNSLSGLRF